LARETGWTYAQIADLDLLQLDRILNQMAVDAEIAEAMSKIKGGAGVHGQAVAARINELRNRQYGRG
jgi:hypothetical protein